MNVEHLEEFVRVVECGSFSEAARAEHLTQSTLSKHIAALERELSCELLVRGNGGVSMTAAGEAVYARARQIGELVSAMREECRRSSGNGGQDGRGKASVEGPRPVRDPQLRHACLVVGRERGLSPAQIGALCLYLEGNGLSAVADALRCTRDEAAATLGAAYEKLGITSKQQALDLLSSR